MSIRDYLQGRSVRFSIVLHRPAPTATKLAHCVHVSGTRVAKAVLVRLGGVGSYALAVLPATHRIDLQRFDALLGVVGSAIAREAEVESTFPDCECGALPPFGRLYGLPTVVDASLVGVPEIVFDANSRFEGVRMELRDYLQIELPTVGEFARRVAPKHPRTSHRRSG